MFLFTCSYSLYLFAYSASFCGLQSWLRPKGHAMSFMVALNKTSDVAFPYSGFFGLNSLQGSNVT